jgi:hypothetical protein
MAARSAQSAAGTPFTHSRSRARNVDILVRGPVEACSNREQERLVGGPVALAEGDPVRALSERHRVLVQAPSLLAATGEPSEQQHR